MRRITQPLFALTLLGITAGAAVWVLPQTMDINQFKAVPDQAIETMSTVGLSVERVTVEGRHNTEASEVLEALGAVRGTPILDINVPQARQAITALPWVRSAEIVRQLPNRLHITLDEYEAYALWQHDGRYSLVAKDGTVITKVTEARAGLVLLVGDDAPRHAAALFDTLSSQPHLLNRVKAAVRFGARRWDVTLDHVETGIVLKLPGSNVAAAWDGLAALDEKHNLLNRAIAEIDLRIADRLVVRLLNGYEPISTKNKTPNSTGARSNVEPIINKELTKGV